MMSVPEFTTFDLLVGQKVALANDEWSLVGRDIILVDIEPVPGSSQCVINAGGEMRYVSRAALRLAA
jgi:hypothetical protein